VSRLVEIEESGVTWVFDFKYCTYWGKEHPSRVGQFYVENGEVFWITGANPLRATSNVQETYKSWLVEKELLRGEYE
jgi:hypothetical protein